MQVVFSREQLNHAPSIIEYGEECVYERPERAQSIAQELQMDQRFKFVEPRKVYSIDDLQRVHTSDCNGISSFTKQTLISADLHYLQSIWKEWQATRKTPMVIPDTFFVRGLARKTPKGPLWTCVAHSNYSGYIANVAVHLENTWEIALLSACCALSAADIVLSKEARVCYALCRPPGHHASSDLYGGWCYINNAALAAVRLSEYDPLSKQYTDKRKVAILDIDYHHGNGTQDIFYNSNRILYVSIHADPDDGGEPHFVGFEEERGAGDGSNYNRNFPLPMIGVTDEMYLPVLSKAVATVQAFNPEYLVISLGCDIEVNDGVGSWDISVEGFTKIGEQIAKLNLPTVVVQEGGYNLLQLGSTVKNFLTAFLDKK